MDDQNLVTLFAGSYCLSDPILVDSYHNISETLETILSWTSTEVAKAPEGYYAFFSEDENSFKRRILISERAAVHHRILVARRALEATVLELNQAKKLMKELDGATPNPQPAKQSSTFPPPAAASDAANFLPPLRKQDFPVHITEAYNQGSAQPPAKKRRKPRSKTPQTKTEKPTPQIHPDPWAA